MGQSIMAIAAAGISTIDHYTRGEVVGLPDAEPPTTALAERTVVDEGTVFDEHAMVIGSPDDAVILEGSRGNLSAVLGRALVRLHHDRLAGKPDAVSKLIWRIASDEDALVDLLVLAAEIGGMLACKTQWVREDSYATAEELNMLISPLALEVLNRDEAMAAFDLEPDEVEPHLPAGALVDKDAIKPDEEG